MALHPMAAAMEQASQQNWEQMQAAAARAAAAPPDQRSADAAAAMESVQLLHHAAHLLPVEGGGGGAGVWLALDHGAPVDRRRVLRALALAATAEYVWPTPMLPPVPLLHGLGAYSQALQEDLGPSGGGGPLERALLAFTSLLFVDDEAACVRQAREALNLLADADQRAAVATGLAQLAEDGSWPLLGADQLRYACCQRAATMATNMVVHSVQAAVGGRRPARGSAAAAATAARRQLAVEAARAMRALEPDSPKTLHAEVEACLQGQVQGTGAIRQAAQLCLKLSRLGAARGRDYWAARGVAQLLQLAAAAPQGAAGAQAQPSIKTALAGADPAGAERALARCRQALPAFSLAELEQAFAGGGRLLAEAKRAAAARGRSSAGGTQPTPKAGHASSSAGPSGAPTGQRSSSGAPPAADAVAADGSRLPVLPPPPPPKTAPCAGCGAADGAARHAMCHRCRKVRYCSRRCQTEHWHQHKQSCQPWVFALQRQAQEADAAADGPEA